MRSFVLTLLLVFLSCCFASSQQVVSNGGACLVTSTGSVFCTLGEPATVTFSTTSGVITQGFQQSRLTVTSSEDANDPAFKILIYPNPAGEILFVSLGFDDLSQVRLFLYEIYGHLISIVDVDKCQTEIDFSRHAPGIYILKVFKGNKSIGAYKIVKTN